MTPREVRDVLLLLDEPDPRVDVEAHPDGRTMFHLRGYRGAVWRGDDGALRLSADFARSDCAAAMQLDYVPPMDPGVWSWLSSDARCPCGGLIQAGWARLDYAYNSGSQCFDRRFVCAECARREGR